MNMKILAMISVALAGAVGSVRAGEPAAATKAPATAAAPAVQTPAKTPAASTDKKESLPVIGYLEKRDRTITIRSGPKGPVYSVATKDGKVLFENLSAEQLKAQAPELHDFIKTGVASSISAPGMKKGARIKLDASGPSPIQDASIGGR